MAVFCWGAVSFSKMKKSLFLLVWSLVLLPVWFTTGCATHHRTSPESYVDDNTLSAKIKSDLLRDPNIQGTAITVTAYQRQVQLTGYVATPQEKERAGLIAASTPGVAAVRNDLVVQTGR